MEAITLDAFRLELTWNRQDARDTRHIAVKRGIEAGDLRPIGMSLTEYFDEMHFRRQVFRIVRAQPAQLVEQCLCHALRIAVFFSAVDDAMADAAYRSSIEMPLEPVHQRRRRRRVIVSLNSFRRRSLPA